MKTNSNRKKTNKTYFNFTSKSHEFFLEVLVWLNTSFTKCNDDKLNQTKGLVDKLFNILRTRGKPEVIKYVKVVRLAFLNFIMLKHNERREFKLPKVLRKIKRFIIKDEKDYPFIRLTLTSLYITRFLRLRPVPSYVSISKGPEFSGSPDDLLPYVVPFLRSLGFNPKYLGKPARKLSRLRAHMTSKVGPNGHALWESLYESTLVMSNENLFNSLCSLTNNISNWIISSYNLYLENKIYFDKKSPSKENRGLIRRISLIPDKEGKTREIAILDYWSQMALKPLHDYFFNCLLRIKQDCTFDQHKYLCKLEPRNGSSFHSIDLTTATDRFPIIIQETILSVWFGDMYAKSWKDIMVGYPFKLPNCDKDVCYSVGNPMGAYSSWSIFAFSHHFLVYIACQKAGVDWKSCPYMMLGDDIVIADDIVAKYYKDLLVEWDIPYSQNKTHVSTRGYEFAKQIIIDGVNVSPFPISALYERRHQYFLGIGIIFSECYEKSWGCEGFVRVAQDYMKVLKYSPKFIRSRESMLDFYINFILYYKGDHIQLGRAIKRYVGKKSKDFSKSLKGGQWVVLTQALVLKVLAKTFNEGFNHLDSETKVKESKLILTSILMKNLKVEQPLGTKSSQFIPILSIWQLSLENYVRLKRRTEDLTSQFATLPNKMKSLFENIHLNLLDKSFFVRRKDVILLTSLKSASIMVDLLNKTEYVEQYGRKVFAVPWFNKL